MRKASASASMRPSICATVPRISRREAATDSGLSAPVARADGHVESFLESCDKTGDIGGIVLAVGVHEYEDVAACRAGATLDRRAIAHRIRLAQYRHAVSGANLAGGIGGAVVHDQDFRIRLGGAQARQQAFQRRRLVFCR